MEKQVVVELAKRGPNLSNSVVVDGLHFENPASGESVRVLCTINVNLVAVACFAKC